MRAVTIIDVMRLLVTAAIGGAFVVWVLTAAALTQDRFPNGEGKTETLKVCSDCHDPDVIFASPKTASDWTETLAEMKQRGAEASMEEWRAVESYLDKYLALIPINQSQADELVRTMDVTPEVADAIVKYRREHGKFKAVDDIKKVPGLDAAAVDARKN